MDDKTFIELLGKLADNEEKRVFGVYSRNSAIFQILCPILTNLELNFPEAFKSVVERMEKNHAGL